MSPAPFPPPAKPRHDRAALTFLALMAVLLVVGGALLLRSLNGERQSASPDSGVTRQDWRVQLQGAVDEMAAWLRERLDEAADSPAPAPPAPPSSAASQPAAKEPAATSPSAKGNPTRTYPPIAAPAAPHVLAVPSDATWTYDVFFGPAWAKVGQLHYRTMPREQGKLGADMSWTPSGGQATIWFLGMVEPGHVSHANTRFPGFFMHAAYLPQSLGPSARLLWEMPWQGAAGGIRRYDVRVQGWERVSLPAGSFDSARLEGTLRYVQNDNVKAEVAYTLWYSPAAKQVVRLRWMGRAPDESATEMIAELAAHRLDGAGQR